MSAPRYPRVVLLILSLLCSLWLACAEESKDPGDASLDSVVDRGIIEGPITRPVVDAFVPLDGNGDTAAGPDASTAVDAGPE